MLDRAKTDTVIGRTKVADLLKSLPGWGPAKVTTLMEQTGIVSVDVAAMQPLRAHGAGCRINDAAPKVLTADVRPPAAVEITFGQQGRGHTGQGKGSPG